MTDAPDQWGAEPTFAHTFSTGRAAQLRRVVNLFRVARSSALGPALIATLEQAKAGELKDPHLAFEVMDAVVAAMWERPQVVLPGDTRERVPGELVHIDDLTTEEITETYELWEASLHDAARFRGGTAGTGNGAGGKGVAHAAKRPAGARPRKRAGVAG